MNIHASSTLGDLESDLRTVAARAALDMDDVARSNAYQGNRYAANLARVSAGKHGKHYHKAFSVEQRRLAAWEYGPDAAKRQGNMSFEGGSRNQPAHNDIAKSADRQGPLLARDAAKLFDDWFWPS